MTLEESESIQAIESEEQLRQLLEEIDERRRARYLQAHGVEFLEVLERYVNPRRWGFRPSRLDVQHLSMIFDSARCRMRLSPNFDDREPRTSSIYCMFGRLHAPDDHVYMDWQGERHRAWHDVLDPEIYWFLEGGTVEQAVEHKRSREWLPITSAFMATDLGQRLHGIEWSAAFRGFMLEHFGERLFTLFDLREGERWEALRRFVREFYERQPELVELERRIRAPGRFVPPWNLI